MQEAVARNSARHPTSGAGKDCACVAAPASVVTAATNATSAFVLAAAADSVAGAAAPAVAQLYVCPSASVAASGFTCAAN